MVLTFLHNPFQSFMASKTSNKHWLKVNSTYRLKVGNKENEKFEERKKMEFRERKKIECCLGLFCKICQYIFYHAILRVE